MYNNEVAVMDCENVFRTAETIKVEKINLGQGYSMIVNDYDSDEDPSLAVAEARNTQFK